MSVSKDMRRKLARDVEKVWSKEIIPSFDAFAKFLETMFRVDAIFLSEIGQTKLGMAVLARGQNSS